MTESMCWLGSGQDERLRLRLFIHSTLVGPPLTQIIAWVCYDMETEVLLKHRLL